MLDFQGVAADIVARDPGLLRCLPAVEKELLHFEILAAMHGAGHLRHLMFKGGTCLRLCHGALRFSEDLDFSGGKAFDAALLDDIGDVLRDGIGRRYGLDVTVSSPDNTSRKVKRWSARVVTRPSPTTATIGVQRIKIEIDDREHATQATLRPIFQHYDHLTGHYASPLIRSAPLNDIFADKLVAFPMSVVERQNPRYRDVWDMLWMAHRTRDVDPIIRDAESKAGCWGLGDEYASACAATVDRIDDIVASEAFDGTFRRFLPVETFDRTVGNADYRSYMAAEMKTLLGRVGEPDAIT